MIKTLKNQVESCLRDFEETRNSDITLTLCVWKIFYSNKIKNGSVFLQDLYELPREDNVKRIRAKLNEQGKYLPTDLKIARRRGIKEDEWRQAMGYPVKADTYYPTKKESYTDKVEAKAQKRFFEIGNRMPE